MEWIGKTIEVSIMLLVPIAIILFEKTVVMKEKIIINSQQIKINPNDKKEKIEENIEEIKNNILKQLAFPIIIFSKSKKTIFINESMERFLGKQNIFDFNDFFETLKDKCFITKFNHLSFEKNFSFSSVLPDKKIIINTDFITEQGICVSIFPLTSIEGVIKNSNLFEYFKQFIIPHIDQTIMISHHNLITYSNNPVIKKNEDVEKAKSKIGTHRRFLLPSGDFFFLSKQANEKEKILNIFDELRTNSSNENLFIAQEEIYSMFKLKKNESKKSTFNIARKIEEIIFKTNVKINNLQIAQNFFHISVLFDLELFEEVINFFCLIAVKNPNEKFYIINPEEQKNKISVCLKVKNEILQRKKIIEFFERFDNNINVFLLSDHKDNIFGVTVD